MSAYPHVKPQPDRTFKGLRQFNSDEGRRLAGRRDRMIPFWNDWFAGEGLPDRFARALADRSAIDVKEYTESFEFFTRVRKGIREPTVVDLCCGHGLTGILFAMFERDVERVLLVDRNRPATHDRIMEAAVEVAPWVRSKVEFIEEKIQDFTPPSDAGLLAVHACGSRTDYCLELAVTHSLPIAAMPCCHALTTYGDRPTEFDESIGRALAMDIDRTYRLRGAGYDVLWKAIPLSITPMNRVILARPRGASA